MKAAKAELAAWEDSTRLLGELKTIAAAQYDDRIILMFVDESKSLLTDLSAGADANQTKAVTSVVSVAFGAKRKPFDFVALHETCLLTAFTNFQNRYRATYRSEVQQVFS